MAAKDIPTNDPRLERGFQAAEAITRLNAKTFYFASKFLPQDRRRASYAVYAMCRLSDDAVDKRIDLLLQQELTDIRTDIEAVYNNGPLRDDLHAAFKETVTGYAIPKSYFDELLAGIQMDLVKTRYENFDELYLYCYRVAGVVGLIMLKILGPQDPKAQQHAIDLGIAFQLTNILRDIEEDYGRGRIYLPQDEMKNFGVTEEHISQRRADKKALAFLAFQTQRARRFYAQSAPGIRLLPDRPSRLVVSAMKELYAKILEKIERKPAVVFGASRIYTTFPEKIFTLLGILASGSYR